MYKLSADMEAIKAAAKSRYGRVAGVKGFGVGDHSLRVYVQDKNVQERLPHKFQGVPVVIVVTGEIAARKMK